ncbi:hypothetical protein BV25DRAFT_1990033 [Artomyces pyxidatus]|uniref:Uncharacterized protein n=1 Tax=Artomyces pyxidatus TaxID=48021 RepID=A0ACB8T6A1_9AGAM|nr:hypothetical protein BV25DRAFT_1990033 [Artomyces pyxidatus]
MAGLKSLSNLPYDILEHILSQVDSRKDVLSFALTSTLLCDIAIPNHYAYRHVDVAIQDLSIWTHLAERPDRASNVRKLFIRRRPIETLHPLTTVSGPVELADLDDHEQDQNPLYRVDIPTVTKAVLHMQKLKTLEVTGLEALGPHALETLSRIFRRCLNLERVAIHRLFPSPWIYGPSGLNHDEISSRLIQLREALASIHQLVIPSSLVAHSRYFDTYLSFCRNLKVLYVPICVGFADNLAISFSECHFPSLKELTLRQWTARNGRHIATFLRAHPTIERLVWHDTYPGEELIPLGQGTLPALRHLTTDFWGVVEVLLREARHRTLTLESLDCPLSSKGRAAAYTVTPHSYPVPLVLPGRGKSVRKLSTRCKDLATLRGLAAVFPSLTHLYLRDGLSVPSARTNSSLNRFRLSISTSKPRQDGIRPTIDDALALFPALEVLGGIEFKNSEHMRDVLARYPRIRAFENPGFG